jgi:hypothetical protein
MIGVYYFKEGEKLANELNYLVENGIIKSGEYQLPDALRRLTEKGMRFMPGEVDEWLDCGNKEVTVITNQRVLEYDSEKGIELVDPSAKLLNSVIIPPCYIGKDVVLENSVVGPHVSLGKGSVVTNSIIKNSIFDTIDRNGIIVDNGYGNRSRSNSFINVGNDGGGNSNGMYSHIKFTVQDSGLGNSSSQDSFDRSKDLADPNAANWGDTYIAEVEGTTYFENLEPKRINGLGPSPTQQEIFRLPIGSSTGFSVKYVWQSATAAQMRKGTLSIAIDLANNDIELVDEYESTRVLTSAEPVIFYASIVNDCVVVYYTNSNVTDNAALTYTYSVLS